jgi:hypothetical protein
VLGGGRRGYGRSSPLSLRHKDFFPGPDMKPITKIRGSANRSSMPSRPGSVMAGRAPCRSVHSEGRRRGMAFGLACAFCAEIAEFRRSPRFSRLAGEDQGPVFRAAGANASRRSHDLCVLCAKIGRDATTDVCNQSPSRFTSSLDGRNRSYGTEKSVFCSEIERGRMRNAVRGPCL